MHVYIKHIAMTYQNCVEYFQCDSNIQKYFMLNAHVLTYRSVCIIVLIKLVFFKWAYYILLYIQFPVEQGLLIL